MRDASIFARLRDFCLTTVGSVGLFFAVLLAILRLRFPGLTESNLGAAYWGYLAVAVFVTVSCAALYARVDRGLPNRSSGV